MARDLINELSFVQDISLPETIRSSSKRTRADDIPAPPSPVFNDNTADSPLNMWAASYIPQYSGRQDFPSIPMQLPASDGSLQYMSGMAGEPLSVDAMPTAENHLFWQSPMGLELVLRFTLLNKRYSIDHISSMIDWDHYVARMADELNQNVSHVGASDGI